MQAWWRAMRQNRFYFLSSITGAAWAWTASTLLFKGATVNGMYLIGLALLATIFIICFMWAAWREPG